MFMRSFPGRLQTGQIAISEPQESLVSRFQFIRLTKFVGRSFYRRHDRRGESMSEVIQKQLEDFKKRLPTWSERKCTGN